MHKFFCNYNPLTEKFELSFSKNFNTKISIQATNTLLPEIKNNLQLLYDNLNFLKDKISDENDLEILNNIELKLSNFYYDLFTFPLDLTENTDNEKSLEELLIDSFNIVSYLIETINIPEYNRICEIIKNSLQNFYNKL